MKNIFIKTNRNFYLKHNTTATLISPTFISNNKSKKNSLTKTNVSTSLDSKTKYSKKNSILNFKIKPFLIYEEQKKETIIKKENKLNNKININTNIIKPEEIFHLKNYQSNLTKYSQINKNENEKKRLGKIIFAEMNNKYYNSKISIKNSRDKTINNETIKIKQILRFWKGVMNISLPSIITSKIQNEYENNIFKNKKGNTTYSFRRINF